MEKTETAREKWMRKQRSHRHAPGYHDRATHGAELTQR